MTGRGNSKRIDYSKYDGPMSKARNDGQAGRSRAGAYGKAYQAVTNEVVRAGLSRNALRVFLFALPLFRDGDKLEGARESAALAAWIAENMPGASARGVQVVQFGYSQAAAALECHKNTVRRAMLELSGAGVLVQVCAPSRNHAAVYAVCPELGTHLGVYPMEKNEYTSGRVPNPAIGYTSHPDWVHISPQLGTHADALTCANETHPEYNPEVNPEVKEKEKENVTHRATIAGDAGEGREPAPPQCPNCGEVAGVRMVGGFLTCSCGTAWRASPRASPGG